MVDERVITTAGQGPRSVLLDCDPGIDDAVAILYLAGRHHAGEIELVGISTTGGNASAEQTALNARWLLDACGLPEVPVGVGRPAPPTESWSPPRRPTGPAAWGTSTRG